MLCKVMKPPQVRRLNYGVFPDLSLNNLPGLLSFAVYHLLKNPDAMAKLQAEIDDVIGDQRLQVSDLGKLPYLTGEALARVDQ
jgi:hypothetical protein